MARRLKIVIAPDSFKESVSAEEVCRAVEKGIRRVYPSAEIVSVPMADGGEGTMTAMVQSAKGTVRKMSVTGPLGKKVQARYGLIDSDRTAVIEMAQASGLALVPPDKRDPMITSSYGTGEQILDAIKRGCGKIVLTLGGVATNDAGAGMAEAVGYRFLDSFGRTIPRGAQGLAFLSKIDARNIHPSLRATEFVAACDVKNPLCGPKGSAAVYGPQKGATPSMIKKIDASLRRFAGIVGRDLGVAVLNRPGSGAAGGAGAGAIAFFKARLKPGIEIVTESAQLAQKLKGADLVVTGEGKIDGQTLFGKTPAGVADAARKARVPVVAICGKIGRGATLLHKSGIRAIFSIADGPISYEESLAKAPELIAGQAEQIMRLIDIFRS